MDNQRSENIWINFVHAHLFLADSFVVFFEAFLFAVWDKDGSFFHRIMINNCHLREPVIYVLAEFVR